MPSRWTTRASGRSRRATLVRTGAVRLAALCIVAVLGAGACSTGGDGLSPSGSSTGDSTAEGAEGIDYLVDPSGIPDLLYEQFGEVPQLRRLSISSDTIRAQVRDPQIPENLDDWVFREGEWTSSPVSVSMSEIEQLDAVTFVPGAIAWDRIPVLIEATYAGVDLEDEEISSVSYDRIAGDPPRVYIGVSGSRGNGRLLGLADGTEFDVERS